MRGFVALRELANGTPGPLKRPSLTIGPRRRIGDLRDEGAVTRGRASLQAHSGKQAIDPSRPLAVAQKDQARGVMSARRRGRLLRHLESVENAPEEFPSRIAQRREFLGETRSHEQAVRNDSLRLIVEELNLLCDSATSWSSATRAPSRERSHTVPIGQEIHERCPAEQPRLSQGTPDSGQRTRLAQVGRLRHDAASGSETPCSSGLGIVDTPRFRFLFR